jgi:serine/threonine protein kinase
MKGTPGFFAPEIKLCRFYEGKMADMWSIGAMTLELVYGFTSNWIRSYKYADKHPVIFQNKLKSCLLHEMQCLGRGPYDDIEDEDNLIIKHLLQKLLMFNPNDRYTASETLNHAWFKEGYYSRICLFCT